jgi:UDP-MurNAc hydroxylase
VGQVGLTGLPDIRSLGHAGFTVTCGGVRLVADPWFYPAFLGSWFPWPDNRHLRLAARDPDWLYISHAHEDHFDRRFLATISRHTRLLVPGFRSGFLERQLAGMGFGRLTVLGHGESVTLAPGFTVTMLLDRSHKEDSALLAEAGGLRFLDANDCELAAGDWPECDVLACQFSGASWYPHCYAYPPDVMAAKTTACRAELLGRLVRKVRLTGARAYWPSAGPAVFLDPALAAYNEPGIFPLWPDVAAGFSAACPLVDVVPPGTADLTVAEYRQARAQEWMAWYGEPETAPAAGEVEAHFARLERLNKRMLSGYAGDLHLDDGGRSWSVRLGTVAGQLEDEPPEPSYRLHVPPRVLRAVLDGRATWETALLSMRLRLDEPHGYDSTAMGLLMFGDRPAQTMQMVRQRDNGESVVRDGLEMQRWCPHAGEDLSLASVRDGVIECARHHWRWDASTGRCIAGGDLPLRVRQLDVSRA